MGKGALHTPRRLLLAIILSALIGYLIIFLIVSWQARGKVLGRMMVRDDREAQAVFGSLQEFIYRKKIQDLRLAKSELRELDRTIKLSNFGNRVERVRIVDPTLSVVYASDQEDLKRVTLDDPEMISDALAGRTLSAMHSEVGEGGEKVEFYAPLRGAEGGIIGAAEVYFDLEQVMLDFASASWRFFWILFVFLVLFSLALFVYSEFLLGRMERERMHSRELELRSQSLQSLASAGILVSGLAHQLRNPIAVLKGVAHSLRKRANDQTSSFVQALEEETSRISNLAESFLTFAKPLGAEQLSGSADLSSICEKLKGELLNRRPDMQFTQLNVDGIWLEGNPVMIYEVFANIGLNSLEVMRNMSAAKLEIEASANGDRIMVFIRDSGPGWPSQILEDEELAFKPFYTTKPNGTGLGLAMCKRIIQSLNGEIHLRNSKIGGAEVELVLKKFQS